MTTIVGLVHSGDSIAGSNSPASYFHQAYSWTPKGDSDFATTQKAAIYYSSNIIATNLAIAGTHLTGTTPDLVQLALTDIDPIIPVGFSVPPNDRARKYIFTCAIGSNDGAIAAYGTTVLYAAAVAACCNLRRTAGFNKLGMCTLLPRDDGTMTEINRLSYNTELKRAGFLADCNIDFIIDLAGESTMGNAANITNATYYEQVTKIHPTAAGHLLLAPIYSAAVNTIVATL